MDTYERSKKIEKAESELNDSPTSLASKRHSSRNSIRSNRNSDLQSYKTSNNKKSKFLLERNSTQSPSLFANSPRSFRRLPAKRRESMLGSSRDIEGKKSMFASVIKPSLFNQRSLLNDTTVGQRKQRNSNKSPLNQEDFSEGSSNDGQKSSLNLHNSSSKDSSVFYSKGDSKNEKNKNQKFEIKVKKNEEKDYYEDQEMP